MVSSLLDAMHETEIAKKYAPGPRQGALIAAAENAPDEETQNIIAMAKIVSDKTLNVAQRLQKEFGVDVDNTVGNKSARTENRRIDIEKPVGVVEQLEQQSLSKSSWISRT